MVTQSHSKFTSVYFLKYGFLAFPLSFLGIPLYMNIPKFYHDYYDISLAKIGLILFAFRVLDAFIDPILGFISDKFYLTQKKYFVIFSIGLILFFNGFFHVPLHFSKEAILLWFAFCTIFVYLFFSLIFINYYNLGLRLVEEEKLKVKLSSFREFLGFSGMIFACVTPSLFSRYLDSDLNSFVIYGMIFAMLLISAIFLLPGFEMVNNNISSDYKTKTYEGPIQNIRYIYHQESMRWLIILFFVNSIPIAITSNLFSFYIEESLNAKSSMPFFLMVYLFSAALSAIMSSIVFSSANKIHILFAMMILSSIGFSITYFICSNNSYIFYFTCVISGLGLGGESVMLLAIAADVMGRYSNYGNTFFAVWSSASKISLALGAGIFLPLISINEYYLTSIPSENKITFLYTIVPLMIKMISIVMLFSIKSKILKV